MAMWRARVRAAIENKNKNEHKHEKEDKHKREHPVSSNHISVRTFLSSGFKYYPTASRPAPVTGAALTTRKSVGITKGIFRDVGGS
jgi:hypothetical protein